MEIFSHHYIPLWLKLSYTVFVLGLIPIYWRQYGPANFLWFSDIALVTTVAALWLESPLLTSMMALAVVLLDVAWNVDFFTRLAVGKSVTGLGAYMFDPKISRTIRAISLFHIVFPVLLIWMLHRLGYDSRALAAQTVLAWIILPLSYFLTKGSPENINWIRGFGNKPQQRRPAPLHLMLLMILFPLIIYLPSHFLFRWIFGSADS